VAIYRGLMWKIQRKNQRKKVDCSKVATYKKRNIFSMRIRFSKLLFSNPELLQKKSISLKKN
jgi:hypothetical protein